jgi:sucrose-6-phosphate hydrolase SacC (GH32 family)
VQRPVAELRRLRGARRQVAPRAIPAGTLSLAADGIRGKALEIAAELDVGTASEAGLEVRTGDGEATVIGVDAKAGVLFVDRRRSGDVRFHPEFASARQTAPVAIERGRVRLRVFVDWSSVEVFANDGRVAITDQIFPAPGSDGVALFAAGGAARLVSLEAWPLASAWTTKAAESASREE